MNWKSHVSEISKKIRRNIGIIFKLRNLVNINILKKLYYSLIYPYLTYGLVAWGNTYASSINPIFILQKTLICLMTFSEQWSHQSSFYLIRYCEIPGSYFLSKCDIYVWLSHWKLTSTFQNFFLPINQKHKYNTRLASRSSYSLPQIRTNYGKFNIRFAGPKIWNEIDEELKSFKKSKFKHELKKILLLSYTSIWVYSLFNLT